MAADTVTRSAALMDVEEDLTDEQMQTLLDQAADRLRQDTSLRTFEDDEEKQYKFPRLDVGEITQSYVKPHKGVVQMEKADRHYENQRKSSNQIRKVEDPVAVRQRAAEVCHMPAIRFAYEEDISQLSLEQSPGTVLVALLHH